MHSTMNGFVDVFEGFPMTDPFQQQMNQMIANEPVSILCSVLMIFGLVLMTAGIVLAIWLKKKSKKES